MDLVELTAHLLGVLAEHRLIARVSMASPICVEVPCALM